MAITINGTGSITGLTAGGLPDGSIVAGDLASGAITSGALPTGSILNVAEVQITSATTHTSNGSHTRFAAMDSSYTTTASSSKILVIFNFMLSNSAAGSDANPKLFRKIGSGSASEIYANPSPAGSSTTGWIGVFRGYSVADGGHRPTFSILDNPGHTAGDVLTYEHHWRTESNDIRLNIGAQTGDARHATTISTVLFLEVAA